MLRLYSILSVGFLRVSTEAFLLYIIRDCFTIRLQTDAEHCEVTAAVNCKPLAYVTCLVVYGSVHGCSKHHGCSQEPEQG